MTQTASNGRSEHGETTPRTIVAVLAHPDDETFIIGGTLALYASRGHNVHVIYGPFGPEPDGRPTTQRLSELEAAANTLGITANTFPPGKPSFPRKRKSIGTPSPRQRDPRRTPWTPPRCRHHLRRYRRNRQPGPHPHRRGYSAGRGIDDGRLRSAPLRCRLWSTPTRGGSAHRTFDAAQEAWATCVTRLRIAQESQRPTTNGRRAQRS